MLDAGGRMLEAGFWRLDTGCWRLEAGYRILEAGYWILGAGCRVLEAGYWILDMGSWISRNSPGQDPEKTGIRVVGMIYRKKGILQVMGHGFVSRRSRIYRMHRNAG